MKRIVLLIAALFLCPAPGLFAADAPAAGDKVGRLPHVEFNARDRQVRVECEMLACDAPLEFFCCVKGTNDYEAMIHSEAKPSHLHLALLAIGLKPGHPLLYSEAAKRWIPPDGPPLQITMEYQKNGHTIRDPAWRWMRDVHKRTPAPPFTWVFAGSRVLPDGRYAADITGYLVSIVNFDLTVIDVPQLASSSNDLLEWERNPDVTPPAGTKVWMIIEPVGNQAVAANVPAAANASTAAPNVSPATQPAAASLGSDASRVTDAEIDQARKRIQELQDEWNRRIAPHRGELEAAAEAHYRIVQEMHTQQQKLIDEADRIQRAIDELEKSYQDMTTPRPPPSGP